MFSAGGIIPVISTRLTEDDKSDKFLQTFGIGFGSGMTIGWIVPIGRRDVGVGLGVIGGIGGADGMD